MNRRRFFASLVALPIVGRIFGQPETARRADSRSVVTCPVSLEGPPEYTTETSSDNTITINNMTWHMFLNECPMPQNTDGTAVTSR